MCDHPDVRRCDGFLYVYNITWPSDFDEMSAFREGVLRAQDREHVPMVLVGNKCDEEDKRQVTASEGAQVAGSLGCAFFESSAKTRINVEESFAALVRAIRQESRDANGTNSSSRHQGRSQRRQSSRCVLS
jgi:GTPase KRas protein